MSAVLLLAAAAPPAPSPAGEVRVDLPPPTREVLANGLRAIIMEDHAAPVVSVQVWYHVGSKDDPEGKHGIAHLFEHLMFRGTTKHGPGEFDRLLDGVGGHNNAFTAEDVTAYHEELPAEALPLALELEADRMRGLVFEQKILSPERQVVEEEKRRSYDNSPISLAYEEFQALAYTTHPYRYPGIGTVEELESVTPAEARAFYDHWYQPANAVLVVVGDVKTAEVLRRVHSLFDPLPRAEVPRSRIPPEPPQARLREKTLTLETSLPMVIAGWHIPEEEHADLPALEILERILAAGQSSRLYRALVKEKKLAEFAGADAQTYEDPALFTTYAGFLPPVTPGGVREALLGEVDRVVKAGVSEEELAKAKNQLTAEHVFGLGTVDGKASSLARAELLEGGYQRFLEETRKYAPVTPADVKRVAATYLRRENLTVLTLLPREGSGQ